MKNRNSAHPAVTVAKIFAAPFFNLAAGGGLLLLALSSACGTGPVPGEPDPSPEAYSTVEGRVTDDDGASAQVFGGEGTVSQTSSLQARKMNDLGGFDVIAAGGVDADGAFTMEVPANEEHLFIDAVDADGEILATALLERSADEDETTRCTPLNAESTLEAAVWASMRADEGMEEEEISYADIRARIDADLAAAVRNKAEANDPDSVDADVRALAVAIHSAQMARVESYNEAGLSITLEELAEIEEEASLQLSADLYEAEDADAAYDAHTEFYVALGEIADDQGASLTAQSDAATASSFAFRASVEANLEDESNSEAVLDRAIVAAARAEARTTTVAFGEAMTHATFNPIAHGLALDAAADLRSELALATTASQAENAWAGFRAEVIGDDAETGTVISSALTLTIVEEEALQSALAQFSTATAALDSELVIAAQEADAVGGVDVDVLAQGSAEAFADYRDSADSYFSALSVIGADIDAIAEVAVHAQGAFRLGSDIYDD